MKTRTKFQSLFSALPLAAAFFFALLPSARCQSAGPYVFTKIVDGTDPMPNGAGALFGIADPQPALDGGTIVFRNGLNTLAPDSVWSITNGTFKKLVDLNTTVPGGTGKFSSLILDFSAPGFPVLSAGTVIFAGRDSATSGYTGGLYSVPVAGGAITRIANRNVAIPGGTGNFNGGLQFFSVDNGRVAFNGVGVGNSGVFSGNVNGSSLVALADVNHPAHPEFIFPVTNFAVPSISGTTVAFYGNTVFDPSNGYNALYTTPSGGGYAYNEPATSNEPLPGDSTVVFHTRFGSPRLDGSTIFFRADDANTTTPNFAGLFSVPTSGGPFSNLVDINDTLPGLTNINSNSFTSYSAANGILAFTAFDDSGNSGLYSHAGSTISKVLATGDFGPFTDTHARDYTATIGTEALSDGLILFRADVRFAAAGIYLATPLALSADLRCSFSPSLASVSVGSNTTLSVILTNNGASSAQTVSLKVALPVGLTFQSAVGGVYNSTTRTVTFSLTSLAKGASKAFAVVARVDATGVLTATALSSSITPESDRSNNHAYASVNATPASSTAYVFRKIVDNNTPVPDRTGETFVIPGGNNDLAALDGNKVAFISLDPQGKPVIWSANADATGGLLRLAGPATAVPAGGGTKFDSLQFLRLRNDVVTFFGTGVDQLHDGIYSVPVAGGSVQSVVNSNSLRPEGTGTTFGYQGFLQNFSIGYLADGQMGFTAQGGVYAYPAAGNGIGHVLVYPGSSIPIAAPNEGSTSAVFFGGPSFSGTRSVFQGSGGANALLGTYLDERRFFALADAQTPSPSTPGSDFVLGNGDSFAGAQLEGNTVVFRAFSGTNAEIKGIYSIAGNGPAVKLVDTNTTVPGGKGKFTGFSAAGSPDTFGLSAGEVVFLGTDADGRGGFYSVPAGGGTITKIIAVGDMLDSTLQLNGNPSFFAPPFQPNSLGEHQLVFRADFLDTTTNSSGNGLFVVAPAFSHPLNISTRLNVQTGDNVLIGGFIITGTAPKKVILRGIGPSLSPGIADVLADPTLELHKPDGTVVTNDNWKDTQEQEIIDSTIPPTNDLESAIIATLDPGAYTVVLAGKDGGAGVGLVEAYDLDQTAASQLANISTRGFVESGEDVMIGGFIIGGANAATITTVIARAIGPSLAGLGIANSLPNPTLELHDSSGAIIALNDDWMDSPDKQTIIDTGLAPTKDKESALLATLVPGGYTAIVRGVNNTTGVALVEAYNLQ